MSNITGYVQQHDEVHHDSIDGCFTCEHPFPTIHEGAMTVELTPRAMEVLREWRRLDREAHAIVLNGDPGEWSTADYVATVDQRSAMADTFASLMYVEATINGLT